MFKFALGALAVIVVQAIGYPRVERALTVASDASKAAYSATVKVVDAATERGGK